MVKRQMVVAVLGLGLAALALADTPTASMSCQVLDPELQLSYQGGCENGLAHGQGVARGEDGAFYQGGFQAGAASGYGVKLYANGDAYAGQWHQGYRHGQGMYEYGEQSPWRGDKYVGQWQFDQRHGQGSYLFYPTGEAFNTEWVQGQAQSPAPPMMIRRKRAAEALLPVLGQAGTKVCSTLTDGASPQRIAHGQVLNALEDRIQVRVDTPEVLEHSTLTLNPRWDVITIWTRCTP